MTDASMSLVCRLRVIVHPSAAMMVRGGEREQAHLDYAVMCGKRSELLGFADCGGLRPHES